MVSLSNHEHPPILRHTQDERPHRLAEDDGSADEAGDDDAHRDRDLPQLAGHIAVILVDVPGRGLRGRVDR